MEDQGDLAAARTAWLDLVPRIAVGPERDALVARARRLDARLSLRAEIVAARARDERVFAELGVTGADADGLTVAQKRVAWRSVPFDLLERLAAAARASRDAANGLVFEKLARGNEAELRAAWGELAKRLEHGDVAALDAFAAIAHARDEVPPTRGYVYDAKKGTWSSVDAQEAHAAAAGLEELATKFVTAPAAERDRAWQALLDLGPDARERVDRALTARFEATCRSTKRAGLDRIEAVAVARKALDERRTKALALIFDEDTYFYPYNPPECPPDKARLYAGVQQRVDELVSAVRDAWKVTRKASVSASLRTALEDVDWCRARAKERKLKLDLPAEVPAWIDGLDRAADSVDLRSFAWDPAERAQLNRDELVRARNRRLWAAKAVTGTDLKGKDLENAVAGKDEQDQVEITNDYRAMFGRVVLAWNPRLQASSQGHSDYMANTGDFSHYEKDEKRRDPYLRMRLVGYTSGASENCHMGGDGPAGAHAGWTHSSGHHRNILTPTHREMGSAAAGDYWTQNFGIGREFEKDLTPSKP